MRAAELASLVLVGALWGASNSFLRQDGAEGGADDAADDDAAAGADAAPAPAQAARAARGGPARAARGGPARAGPAAVLDHLAALLANRSFTVPFLVNQSGSLLYYLLLGSTELSLAVPICNATTFVFTLLTAVFVRGEKQQGDPILLFAGVICIVVGVGLMSLPKSSTPSAAPTYA